MYLSKEKQGKPNSKVSKCTQAYLLGGSDDEFEF